MNHMNKTIEAELRSIIDEKKYAELTDFFARNAMLQHTAYQETHYLHGMYDLRIQRSDMQAKVWLKKGIMHSNAREEIAVHCSKDEFGQLEKLFSTLGFTPKIKWFRWRKEYRWRGTTVCLDYSRGYGYMLELERLCTPAGKGRALAALQQQAAELGITPTPKAELDKRLAYYARHWKRLTASGEKIPRLFRLPRIGASASRTRQNLKQK